MFGIRKGLLAIVLILLFTGGLHWPDLKNFGIGNKQPSDITLSDARRVHILYGDATGGGHKFGTGKPCKSEFPQDWNDEDIVANIQKLAANDNLPWERQKNGYYVADGKADGVRMRVVLNGKKDSIITAYPLAPSRNGCPGRQPANDNLND